MIQIQIKDSSTEASLAKSPKVKPSRENVPQAYGTGKRKNSIARVWLKAGTGNIIINEKVAGSYFCRDTHIKYISAPLEATKSSAQYDVICYVKGGGLSGQAGAIVHGVAKALVELVPDFRSSLRQGGFLTRDSRVVERKKYGKHKARKSTQFSKR